MSDNNGKKTIFSTNGTFTNSYNGNNGCSKNNTQYNLNPLSTKMDAQNSGLENYDLICFSHLRWDFVFQRPQHLLTRCALKQRVFYIEEPVFESIEQDHFEISTSKEGVTIATPHLKHGYSEEELNASLKNITKGFFRQHGIARYIFWYYTPMALSYTNHFQPELIIYDCMDELSMFKDAPATLLDNEEKLFKKADLVFTGGQSLYEYKKDKHYNIHPFPSSIDKQHFSSGIGQPDPADQAKIAGPRIGFFGVIDERLDIALLDGVAKARPDWQIIMIGPIVKINPADLPKHNNIHYLGPKNYQELPLYLAHWDAAFLPFAKNESTRFISPTKTPEYLCANIPVVSTSITDVVKPYGEMGIVNIADEAGAFVKAIEFALVQKEEKEWQEKVDKFLASNSWDLTWQKMSDLVKGTIYDQKIKVKAPVDNILNNIGMGAGNDRAFDYVIVGAGFAGSVLAERLATQENKKVLLIDKRNHIAGNAYDFYDDAGILIHKYGPHIFHTNSKDVFQYLSKFTSWRDYQHRVLASIDGTLVPIPINLNTINTMYGYNFNSTQLEDYFASVAEPKTQLLTSEDVVVNKVGRELYEKFFKSYTRKQWGLDPSELNASVTSRVPTRTNRDDRYFTDSYQAMPLHGYTKMFQNMLSHPNIKIMLNTDYKEIMHLIPYKEIIYTGPIDEFFGFKYGKLPYRSLQFVFETHDTPVYQKTGTINYPNDNLYTRITEFKYLTGQQHNKTSIVFEYPKAEGDPYYPVPQKENNDLYKRYEKLAAETAPDVRFVGRLATYKYYNMDQVVAQALGNYKKIAHSILNNSFESKKIQYSN